MSISQLLHDLLTTWLMGGGTPVLVTPVGSPTYVPAVAEVAVTFVYDETSVLEQVASGATLAARAEVGSIWLDMVNVTQDTTIRVYHQIDGTNYRLFQENIWVTTDDDGILIDGFVAYRDVQITMQCAGGGGGNVNVPILVI